MIRREIKKNNHDMNRVYFDEDTELSGNPDDVVSVDVIRGGSSYDPEMITTIVVTYVDSSVETITLMRGVNPPLPNTVPDYEFYNNVLITGFTVAIVSPSGSKQVHGKIDRDGGYGKVLKLNLSYT